MHYTFNVEMHLQLMLLSYSVAICDQDSLAWIRFVCELRQRESGRRRLTRWLGSDISERPISLYLSLFGPPVRPLSTMRSRSARQTHHNGVKHVCWHKSSFSVNVLAAAGGPKARAAAQKAGRESINFIYLLLPPGCPNNAITGKRALCSSERRAHKFVPSFSCQMHPRVRQFIN